MFSKVWNDCPLCGGKLLFEEFVNFSILYCISDNNNWWSSHFQFAGKEDRISGVWLDFCYASIKYSENKTTILFYDITNNKNNITVNYIVPFNYPTELFSNILVDEIRSMHSLIKENASELI